MSISPRFFADHVSVTVANIDAAIEFYDRALGAEVLYRMGPLDSRDAPRENNGKDWTEAHVNVTDACLELAMLSFAGGMRLEVFQYRRPDQSAASIPRNCNPGASHLCFRVDDLDAAITHLENFGCVKLPASIVSVDGPAPPSVSQYILDPFGYQLELVEYS